MRVLLILMMALGMSTFSIGGVTDASADIAFPDQRRSTEAEDDRSDQTIEPLEDITIMRIFFTEPEGKLEVAGIRQRLRSRKSPFQHCYERQLQVDEDMEGIIQLGIEVRSGGLVKDISLQADTVEGDYVKECVIRVAERVRFEQADGPTSFSVLFEFGFPLPEESPVEGMDYSLHEQYDQSDGENDTATEKDDDEQSSMEPSSGTAFVSAMSLLLGLIGMSWGFVSMRRRD